MKDRILEYVLERAGEKSTWVGIVTGALALASQVGLELPITVVEPIVSVCLGVVSVVLILVKTKKK